MSLTEYYDFFSFKKKLRILMKGIMPPLAPHFGSLLYTLQLYALYTLKAYNMHVCTLSELTKWRVQGVATDFSGASVHTLYMVRFILHMVRLL